ncbi:MAG: selenoprotein B, partial [Desulfohalobiaceae bacterium]
ALWVPFELGRPLGAPNELEFQKKVLRSALGLLEAKQGPVLQDFPEDAPGQAHAAQQEAAWACPISFAAEAEGESDLEQLISALQKEMAELKPWYDLGLEQRGRTALADFEPETAAALLTDFLQGKGLDTKGREISDAVALRLAVQDLKAFYFEAAISRPGAEIPDSQAFGRWFWQQTAAGRVFKAVQQTCAESQDKEVRLTGKMS